MLECSAKKRRYKPDFCDPVVSAIRSGREPDWTCVRPAFQYCWLTGRGPGTSREAYSCGTDIVTRTRYLAGSIMISLESPMAPMHHQRRQHVRCEVKIIASIRVSGGLRNKVQIVELSQTGFHMECLAFLPEVRPVLMTPPGFVQLECDVMCRSEWRYGAAFAVPLDEGAYHHIVKEYPALMAKK